MDCSLPGSSVHGILQARILEWVVMPSSRGLSDPRIEPVSLLSPALTGRFFITSGTWEAQKLGTGYNVNFHWSVPGGDQHRGHIKLGNVRIGVPEGK